MKAKRSQGQVMKHGACVSGCLVTGLDPQSCVEAREHFKEDNSLLGVSSGRISPVLRVTWALASAGWSGVSIAVTSSYPGADTLIGTALNL